MTTSLIPCNYQGFQATLQAVSLIFDSWNYMCVFPGLWLSIAQILLIVSWGGTTSQTFCFVLLTSAIFICALSHLYLLPCDHHDFSGLICCFFFFCIVVFMLLCCWKHQQFLGSLLVYILYNTNVWKILACSKKKLFKKSIIQIKCLSTWYVVAGKGKKKVSMQFSTCSLYL